MCGSASDLPTLAVPSLPSRRRPVGKPLLGHLHFPGVPVHRGPATPWSWDRLRLVTRELSGPSHRHICVYCHVWEYKGPFLGPGCCHGCKSVSAGVAVRRSADSWG